MVFQKIARHMQEAPDGLNEHFADSVEKGHTVHISNSNWDARGSGLRPRSHQN
jgi:hypothetical protein